ncbi:MAG: P-II family nitrogen regulator [Monoglobales bacterium]
MELYFVISIVGRHNADKLIDLHHSLNLSSVFTYFGRGTATSEHLSFNNLEPSEKTIVGAVATADLAKQLLKKAKNEMYFDIPGNGIMMTIPIKSIGGGKTLAYLTDNQVLGGAKPEMNFENELIIVILNEGFSDTVMEAARSAGAVGGTQLHAKGTGRSKSEKFFGVSLAHEKDMLYIVAPEDKKSAIMQAINKECGTDTHVGAICFSLPVTEVVGIRRYEDD